MEKFKKFDIMSQEGIKELNDFYSKILIIIKDIFVLDANRVLVKYENVSYDNRLFFCPTCMKEYSHEIDKFIIYPVGELVESSCSRCGEGFYCEYYYTIKDNGYYIGRKIMDFIRTMKRSPFILLVANNYKDLRLESFSFYDIKALEICDADELKEEEVKDLYLTSKEKDKVTILKSVVDFEYDIEELNFTDHNCSESLDNLVDIMIFIKDGKIRTMRNRLTNIAVTKVKKTEPVNE